MMNNKGKGSGLALILVLIVALLIAFLVAVVKNMGDLGLGSNTPTQHQENYVQQAQDAVDALNQAQQQAGQAP